jgi:two-component system phosphate regulon sensor histidine kinase PhoR
VSWALALGGAALGAVAGWAAGRGGRSRAPTNPRPRALSGPAEQERFTAVLGSMRAGVIVLDESDVVCEVNDRAGHLLDLQGDPVGRPLQQAIDLPALTCLLGQADPEMAAKLELPGPTAKVLEARVAHPASGGRILLLHDVTERHHLEGIKRDFVANASHELRTPVTVIRANAETLLDGALDEAEVARQFVEGIYRNATRLSDLLSDMLDLSRLEAGRYVLEPRVMPMLPVLEQARSAVQERAASKGVTVDVHAPAELEGFADPRALDQVLVNLIDNAVKYTPSGGSVTLRATALGVGVRLEVADDGPGIPAEHRQRVFERFYRVDTGRSRALGGTGLGLAIVRLLVTAMDGQVGIEPLEPHGSLFWVELPP